jgi:outer membrane protein OmpA-like peptidoglycan-associated protein
MTRPVPRYAVSLSLKALTAMAVVTACTSQAPVPPITLSVATPTIGAVPTRNQFMVCDGCDVAPTPKTLAMMPVVPAKASAVAITPATTPEQSLTSQVPAPLVSLASQSFESGVHPTDLLIRFERGSAVLSASATLDLANLRPALSVPHVLHLVASTDGVGSRRINRKLADGRNQAVLAALNNTIRGMPNASTKRKQLNIRTTPATVRGINPDVRTVLIQVEIL